MEQIKFRVWASNDINPNGKMYYPNDSVEVGVGNRDTPSCFVLGMDGTLFLTGDRLRENTGVCSASISNNGIDVMQFTGLQDKNENDIYDGDIIGECRVGLDDEVIGKIVFNEDYMALVIHKENGGFEYLTEFFTSMQKAVVIGNIYENPNLLAQ